MASFNNYSYPELLQLSAWFSPLHIPDGLVRVMDVVSRTAMTSYDYFTYDVDVYEWSWSRQPEPSPAPATPTAYVVETTPCRLEYGSLLTPVLLLALVLTLSARCHSKPRAVVSEGDGVEKVHAAHRV